MINTIIIDDNIDYIKCLINSVISKLKKVKITHILTNGNDALDIIKNNSVDLILLDLNMPDINGIDIIEKIKKMNLLKIPKVIVISGEVDYIYCVKNEIIISDIIEKNSNFETIKTKLENAIDNLELINKETFTRKMIMDELINLGYSFKYKGTHYLFDSIMYVYMSNNFDLLDNIEKNVYVHIATKYKKSVNNIKTNIIKSTKLVINERYVVLTPKTVINNILMILMTNFRIE